MNEFILTFISSSISIYATQPIDTLKSQFQTNKNSIFHLSKNIYNKQGIRGFYKGSLSMISTYPVFWSIFFSMKNMKITLCNNELINDTYNNFISLTTASTLANPLFVLKTRKQTSIIKNINKSYITEFRDILKHEGLNGMFKGNFITIFNNSKLLLQFPLYEHMINQNYNIITSSFVSKMLTNIIFYPLDIIRTIKRNNIAKTSLITIIKELYKEYGYRGFYRGITLYSFISCPNFIIMMYMKDFLNKFY